MIETLARPMRIFIGCRLFVEMERKLHTRSFHGKAENLRDAFVLCKNHLMVGPLSKLGAIFVFATAAAADESASLAGQLFKSIVFSIAVTMPFWIAARIK